MKIFEEAENPDSPSLGLWPTSVVLSVTDSSYRLQSPKYPLFYPDMMDLEIIFSSPPGSTIVVEFSFFHLENETSCGYDRLSITDKVIYIKFQSYKFPRIFYGRLVEKQVPYCVVIEIWTSKVFISSRHHQRL